jgi:hypothetical protein
MVRQSAPDAVGGDGIDTILMWLLSCMPGCLFLAVE